MRHRRQRRIAMLCLFAILLIMSVGYAAFSTSLNITGTSKITSNWDVEITSVLLSDKTGNAEETKLPTYDKLSASMEANLYEAGDSVTYDVTIENKGTFDAKLEDVVKTEESNSEAVIITFSGFVKGEKLLKNTSKVVKVKLEYNPNYMGDDTTGQAKIEFNYVQNEGGTIVPTDSYLLTYDGTTNGGLEDYEEYINSGTEVELSRTATKKGYIFEGWVSEKDSKDYIDKITIENKDEKVFAVFKKTLTASFIKDSHVVKAENLSCDIYNNETDCEIDLSNIEIAEGYVLDKLIADEEITPSNNKIRISKDEEIEIQTKEIPLKIKPTYTPSVNRISIEINPNPEARASKYEYKINDDDWIEGTKTYTYTGLTKQTEYVIQVRVTSTSGEIIQDTKTITTEDLKVPTFEETEGETTDVVITYQEGCGDELTCTYQVDGGNWIEVTNENKATLSFTTFGQIIAKVTDGTNTVSSSYTYTSKAEEIIDYVEEKSNVEYNDDVQIYTAPVTGLYKLEVWGAQGGSYNTTYAVGGLGGYSYGTVKLAKGSKLYVHTGGEGTYATAASTSTKSGGGTNGGGNAGYRGGGGGGATDIRINEDSLYARVIVAGGGGGAYSYSSTYKANGGAAGGDEGTAGAYYNSSYTAYTGKGGTQTAGGAAGTGSFNGTAGTFGQGGNAGNVYSTSTYSSGAGGGGWYGGGGAANYSSSTANNVRARAVGGGGGSGYVYTSGTASNYPSGCLLNSSYYLTDAKTIGGNESFTSPTGTNETGHSGNGYARITLLGIGHNDELTSTNIPTFTEEMTGSTKTVTIHYPSGCGSEYTCTYEKDNGEPVTVTNTTVNVEFTGIGNLVAKVKTDDNTLSSSYTVILVSIETETTSKSIKVTTDGRTTSNVKKYEYRINGGSWITDGSEHTFTNLTNNKSYTVQTRITGNKDEQVLSEIKTVKTDDINVPTFEETEGQTTDVVITYPDGMCGDYYTCTYQIDGENWIEVTNENKAEVSFTTFGQIIAKVTDGTNTVSSSYTYTASIEELASHIEQITDFEIKEQAQTYIVPTSGQYKLEVWGAQGGSTDNSQGKGGYSYGTINLLKGTELNIYIGGAGTSLKGGYNGGGDTTSSTYNSFGGGGATDIRINSDSLYARVIVAGGGGGGNMRNSGSTDSEPGYGGGISGGNGAAGGSGTTSVAIGGSQTSGGNGGVRESSSGGKGTFGQGGTGGYVSGKSSSGGGGGGGWYGGGGGHFGNSASSAGGGGSGYVYTSSTASNYPSGCLLNSSYYLTDAKTIAGNESFASPTGTNETGHSGDGYARITLLNSIDSEEISIKNLPTFTEEMTGSTKTVTIHYPEGCGSTYTCTYEKDNGTSVTVTSSTANVEFTGIGNLVAKVKKGNETLSSSYTVILVSIETEETTNSIKVTTDGRTTSNVKTYEYRINGGSWVTDGSEHTFTNLTNNTSYTVQTRITGNKDEQVLSEIKTVKTKDFELPTYEESGTTSLDVKITYPESCSKYVCTYSKDGGEEVTVTGQEETVHFDASGTIKAYYYDGHNKVGSYYDYIFKGTDTSTTSPINGVGLPTFSETGYEEKKITINYPSGCGSTLTCSYFKDNGKKVEVTSTSAEVTFDTIGSVVAKVSDGKQTMVNSYNVIMVYTTETHMSDRIEVTTHVESPTGISKYEYRINNGNWTVDNVSHIFGQLNKNTNYTVQVRVTGNDGEQILSEDHTIKTDDINVPTFEETEGETTDVVITYPDGMCGDHYTCTYQIDGGNWIEVTNENKATLSFTTFGQIIAKVADGTNTVSSSYTYTSKAEEIIDYIEENSNVEYNDNVQIYTAPVTGLYKLEVWGAQGGSYNTTYAVGGLGGYSYGTVRLAKGSKLYVHTGGEGTYATAASKTDKSGGGTNGGGNAGYRGGGGGGATDIRINNDSLYARVIVAGGGGGAYSYSSTYKANGGAAGGDEGTAGAYYNSSYTAYTGKGGTQTAGGAAGTGSFNGTAGAFGQGGNAGNVYSTSTYSSGAGGGGWYGGGGAANYSSSTANNVRARAVGGGGGSGYVYTSGTASNYPSGCLLNSSYYLTDAKTIGGNESFTSPSGTEETGHSGNGYARITLLNFSDYKEMPVKKLPTFTEETVESTKTVTIHYPSGCGSTYTCTYEKDNGEPVTVTNTTVNVEFTGIGNLVAKVKKGNETLSSSYTVNV